MGAYSINATTGALTHISDVNTGACVTGAITARNDFAWVTDTCGSSGPWHVITMKINTDGSLTKTSSITLTSVFTWLWSIQVNPAANFLYVESHTHLIDYQAWTGAVGKAVAPFITLVMTEVLGALVTRPAGERGLLAKRTAELNVAKAELRKAQRRDARPLNQRGGTPLSKGAEPYTDTRTPTVAPSSPAAVSPRLPLNIKLLGIPKIPTMSENLAEQIARGPR